jgi:small acid-soluble spore protein F (minor alpha/beta-type SASP)
MSESFKTELARDLGFYNVVQSSGWEGIRAKDAGNMVKRAIQIAEEHLAKQSGANNQQTWLPQSPDQRRYRP